MPENQPAVKYPWQQFVLDAFLELRPEYMSLKFNAAESAISARLCEPNLPDNEESTAIRDALRGLHVLFPEERRTGADSDDEKEIT